MSSSVSEHGSDEAAQRDTAELASASISPRRQFLGCFSSLSVCVLVSVVRQPLAGRAGLRHKAPGVLHRPVVHLGELGGLANEPVRRFQEDL